MNWQKYSNAKIEAIDADAGVSFGCLSSPEGLPNAVLGPLTDLLRHPPSFVRIEVDRDSEAKVLDTYFQQRVGFISGEDYKLHANGQRGGVRYFDFFKPDAITRLETFAAENGLKPAEKPDPYAVPEGASPAMVKFLEGARARHEQNNALFAERERQRQEMKDKNGGFLPFGSPPRPR